MPARPRELHPGRSARDLFGAEMRRLRQSAGMTLEALAAVVSYSKSALARFETAEAMVPPDLPSTLDAAFGTDGFFEKLYALARREVHPDRYRRVMELEERARVIGTYAGHYVPGLLQTEAYAEAVFREFNPLATDRRIQELVAARMGRKELLRAVPAPRYSAILDEAVIRRPIGGPAVMRAQLAALLPALHGRSSLVQVLPFSHGGHALMGGSLHLLELDDGTAVAHEESIASGTLMEDVERVTVRRQAYDVLRAYALSPRQTAVVIREAMEALPDEHQP